MKYFLNCRSLIKVAVIMVVMAFMASQVMDTEAARRNNRGGTTGGGQDGGNKGNAECPTCCDAWDKQLEEDRFVLVMPTEANPDGEAVLDKETCLVWEQSPSATTYTWNGAHNHCIRKEVGGREGWRLPTIAELASLVDNTQPSPQIPAELKTLTSNVIGSTYWSATTSIFDTLQAWVVPFNGGTNNPQLKSSDIRSVWCVRGGQGYDAY